MQIYKDTRKYCIYNNEEYALGKITDTTIDIVSYKQKHGFKKDGEVYINTISKGDIDDIYRLDTKILYKGFLFYGGPNIIFIDGSEKEELASKLGFNMQNKGEYYKDINNTEINNTVIQKSIISSYKEDGYTDLDKVKINKEIVCNEYCIYKGKIYSIEAFHDTLLEIATKDYNNVDGSFNKIRKGYEDKYIKNISIYDITEHYFVKTLAIYKGVKCEVYSVMPGIMLTVAPDTEEERKKLLDLGFYISNTDLNYCEKLVKEDEVELVYERIEMGMF